MAAGCWLLAAGTLVGTGNDYIEFSERQGLEGYRDTIAATDAIRAMFNIDVANDNTFVYLHTLPGCPLTAAQFQLVQEFVQTYNAKVLYGEHPVDGPLIALPETREVPLSELPGAPRGLRENPFWL